MENKKFSKLIEDFKCENCGADVVGNGYTNHCPKCLWSKHVDNNPGDRANLCHGLMKPEQVFVIKGEFKVTQKCLKCGLSKSIFLSKEDSIDTAIKIAKEISDRAAGLKK